MDRAIFSNELEDPDFQWLLTNYNEQRHLIAVVDVPCLPVVLLVLTPQEKSAVLTNVPVPLIPPGAISGPESVEDPSAE